MRATRGVAPLYSALWVCEEALLLYEPGLALRTTPSASVTLAYAPVPPTTFQVPMPTPGVKSKPEVGETEVAEPADLVRSSN